jgi:hypothetical protein
LTEVREHFLDATRREGPGALLSLEGRAGIVAGLDHWGDPRDPAAGFREVREPRLTAGLARRGIDRLYAPPLVDERTARVAVWPFPGWFLLDTRDDEPMSGIRLWYPAAAGRGRVQRSRRMVSASVLAALPPSERHATPIHIVQACRYGHVADIDWVLFAHAGPSKCTGDLFLDEWGAADDVADLFVRCACGVLRCVAEALPAREDDPADMPLGACQGSSPWLGPSRASGGDTCPAPNRLLLRSAPTTYFPVELRALTMPASAALPAEGEGLKAGESAILLGDDLGVDAPGSDFFATELPLSAPRPPLLASLRRVLSVPRLREVVAQVGFTRLSPPPSIPDPAPDMEIHCAPLARAARWVPATERRGEGIFLSLHAEAVERWLGLDAVARRSSSAAFAMLHSLSHLLAAAVSSARGFAPGVIRERVYAGPSGYGVLLYALERRGQGLAGAAETLSDHLAEALARRAACRRDPDCAACPACLWLAGSSCEVGNAFLDRALVLPLPAAPGAAFFNP